MMPRTRRVVIRAVDVEATPPCQSALAESAYAVGLAAIVLAGMAILVSMI